MKGFQFFGLLIILALLIAGLAGLFYFLGRFSFQLALIVEFFLLITVLVIGFFMFDRALRDTE